MHATSYEDLRAALERARETARTARSLAKRLEGTTLRDILMLEVVTLEAVIARFETSLDAPPAAVAEVNAETDRLLSIAADKGSHRTLH